MCEYLSRSSVTVVKWLRLQFELEYYPPQIVTKIFLLIYDNFQDVAELHKIFVCDTLPFAFHNKVTLSVFQ